MNTENVKMWVGGPFLLILAKKQPILDKCLHSFLITQLFNFVLIVSPLARTLDLTL